MSSYPSDFNRITQAFHANIERGVMKIDTGLGVVIVAVLIFYLRLIILQRERVKRVTQTPTTTGKKPGKEAARPSPRAYSILSANPLDRFIAGAGVLAILVGILLNTSVLPIQALQPYWWIPTALGVVAFSWAFKL
jgi:hypothetical protein